MHITHTYIGTTKGRFRCLFFLLLEDYIEAQSHLVRDLDLALERFARKMGDTGVLVRPFTGDIEKTRAHVLNKPWAPAERAEVCKTPGLLMIGVDFDSFNPREHSWLYISLGTRLEGGSSHSDDFAETLTKLAEAVCDADTDVFDAARAVIHEVHMPDVAKMFEAKPGIFGFSVDLIQGAKLLHRLWFRLTKGKHLTSVQAGPDGWVRCPHCNVRFSLSDKSRWDGQRHTTCGAYLLPVGDNEI
jgi:hypothetical protein